MGDTLHPHHHHHMFQQHTRLPLTHQNQHTSQHTNQQQSTLPSIPLSTHQNQHTSQHTNQQQSTPPSTLHQRRFTLPSTPHQRRTFMVNQPTTMDTLSTQVQSQLTICTVHGPRTDTPTNTTNTTQVTAKRVHAMPNTLPDALVTCSTLSTPDSARPTMPKLLFSRSPKTSSVLVKPPKLTGELNVTSPKPALTPVLKDVIHSLISLVKISCQQNQLMQDTTTMIMADVREETQQLKEPLLDHVMFPLVTSNVQAWTSIQPKLHNNLSKRSEELSMLLHQNVTQHGKTQ